MEWITGPTVVGTIRPHGRLHIPTSLHVSSDVICALGDSACMSVCNAD